MNADCFIAARVSLEAKQQLRTLAAHQHLSESAVLKRLLEGTLNIAQNPQVSVNARPPRSSRAARVYVRLLPADRQLLAERATARGVAPGTYLAVLARSHLRDLSPLPASELLAVRAAVAELGAIGRNLNQIARALNQSSAAAPPSLQALAAVLRACEAVHRRTKGLITANLLSWKIGYRQAHE